MGNCLEYNDIHDFIVWPRNSSNPVDINWFRNHTGKNLIDLLSNNEIILL